MEREEAPRGTPKLLTGASGRMKVLSCSTGRSGGRADVGETQSSSWTWEVEEANGPANTESGSSQAGDIKLVSLHGT